MTSKPYKSIKIPTTLTSKTVLTVISKLNDFTNNNEISKLEIDFRKTTFVTPGGLTPLLCYLRDLPKRKKILKEH